MDSSVQGLEFLDLTGISEHEIGELNSILHGGSPNGNQAVVLPWSPPPQAHWADQIIHPAYPAAVPSLVGGVQPQPPPLGHSGPPWVSLPPNSAGEEPVNGGTEEPIDGVQMMRPNVSTGLPIYPAIIHPQQSVIVSNVTPNVNVHGFQQMSYPMLPPHPPPDTQNSASRRQRPVKVTKRVDTPVRRSVDPPQGTFANQHRFSPNAAPYIPSQVPRPYPYYHQQPTPGMPTPQAMAGGQLYLQTMQFPTSLVHVSTYPAVTVYSTPQRPIEHPEIVEIKETVPYPPPPPPPSQLAQDHQDEHTVAATLPAPVLPAVAPQPVSPSPVTLIKAPADSLTDIQVTVKEDEEEDTPVISTVIENSKLNHAPPASEVEKPDDLKNGKFPVTPEAICSRTAASPVQNSVAATKQPALQTNAERKPKTTEEPPSIATVLPILSEPPVQVTPPPPGKTWASLFSNSPSAEDNKLMAAVKPSTQYQVEGNVSANNSASNSSMVSANNSHSQTPPICRSLPQRRSTPLMSTGSNKSLPSPSMADDPRLHELGNFLLHYQLEHKPVALTPRGLTNRRYYCYINATLQALIACPPLYNLLKAIAAFRKNTNTVSKGKSFTPVIDSMVKFINEFDEMSSSGNLLKCRREKAQARRDGENPGGGSGGGVDILAGPAFEPTYIYKALNNPRDPVFTLEGRQEDAEEFLTSLLNGLNDEMVELQKLSKNISNGEVTTNGELYQYDDDNNEWKEVTNTHNRQAVTRRTEVAQTPLSQIFQGQLRSSVQRVGNESTDNIQPFFTLPLDIERAQSVKDALDKMVNRDILEGVRCTKTNQKVKAYQQVTLEQLPLVLLLHLKCFDYKLQTCSKIVKTVEFPIDLKIEQKFLSAVLKNKSKSSGNTGKDRTYKLFAVVYHDGEEATRGHYITDVYHVGYGVWVRYDDATVKSVPENLVLHPKSPRVPYLLYYRRQDTINVSQNPRSQKSES